MSALSLFGLSLNALGALFLVVINSNRLERFIERYYENQAYPAIFDLFSGEKLTPSDGGFNAVLNSIQSQGYDRNKGDTEYSGNIGLEDNVFANSEVIIERLSENNYRPFEYYRFERVSHEELPKPNSIWIEGEQYQSEENDFTLGFTPNSTVVLDYSDKFDTKNGRWNETSLEYCDASEITNSFLDEVDQIAHRTIDKLALIGSILLLSGFILQVIDYIYGV